MMMDALKSAFSDHPYCVGVATGTAAIATSFLAYRCLRSHKSHPRADLLKGPPDTVMLFQIPKSPYAPSMSPFPLKLETYLRMAKIPYENNYKGIVSTKGKTPWMAYNGEAVADSQFCMEYLNSKRAVDLNKHLTPEQRAVAKSFQVLVDEHLYWAFAYFRWVHDDEKKVLNECFGVSRLSLYFIHKMVKKQVWAQGIGRHTPEEIQHIMMTGLTALSNYLGTKSFIMGEVPCETDCSMFGMLSQLVWHQKDEILGNVIQEKFPNLHNHCLRMKEKFWPDWDECLYKVKK